MKGKEPHLIQKFWKIGRNGLLMNFENVPHKCSPINIQEHLRKQVSLIMESTKVNSLQE